MKIPPDFADYVLKSGQWFFVFDVILLALNSWDIFHIPDVWLNVMWVYLLLNTFAVATIIYRKYSLKSSNLICPYCKGQLKAKTLYVCPKCGELKPEK